MASQEKPGFVPLKIPMPPDYDTNRSELANRPTDERGRIRLSRHLTKATANEKPVVPASSRNELERKPNQLPLAVGDSSHVADLRHAAIQRGLKPDRHGWTVEVDS